MIKNSNDIGFIHDISSLDKLRQKAVSGKEGDDDAALRAAARQFESIFTSMMLKSMRDANTHFESDLTNSQNGQFYRQMLDEQMSSELSANGSLGLADMIVAQLGAARSPEAHAAAGSEIRMRNEAFDTSLNLPYDEAKARKTAKSLGLDGAPVAQPVDFKTPQSFVESLKPYADRAAQSLGVDSSLLLAQAALETGWGQKVVNNSKGSSNNLFNIKADRSWHGDKVATQTLEYHQNVPVQERAAFRSYDSYEDSFNDYVKFLNDNPRYQSALNGNQGSERFIRDVHQAGYATDPNYADKVLRVKAQIDDMSL
ncbi:flagellar assembly peptidoglycan hydrolase FlgJ [Vibrio mediterranei]|uniref:Peptidoglycan hydrolase FlgJ n=1 Tax=Vibrio mediterranei TaxID=689 RepID=A0A3G4VBT5_9VIBR|nr:flagellar assembly peptidoglycan hydrolase FlgJ [Vibrio mediterranei]AYV20631.1 flagellar assembly peptidoglycan hydrolase FlgJ [Vibrio mediterranei]EDL55001.1 flagellar biosynthesis protein FlgJ [Vibrio mediterranei AK1]